ncbi:hypothetical protein QBC37DRAFT_374483 [Rhypophila decipiens]|uniref:Uncharacterized protein n=1 Tax=Rhypophila decipiens TaxID=261697 RepID=A0AAN6Y6Y1_9PEZI|nr:hypothetical protein QBC37DRAFT_374483 [Rhypophila decipiens]
MQIYKYISLLAAMVVVSNAAKVQVTSFLTEQVNDCASDETDSLTISNNNSCLEIFESDSATIQVLATGGTSCFLHVFKDDACTQEFATFLGPLTRKGSSCATRLPFRDPSTGTLLQGVTFQSLKLEGC